MGTGELGAKDLRAVLELLGATHETSSAAEFADVLMNGLSRVVQCDLISYNEIDLVGGGTQTYFEPRLAPQPEIESAFARLIDQHPLVRDYAASRDPSPLRMSDFINLAELRRLDIYHEVFDPLETDHQLAFSLAIESDVVVGIGLNRRRLDFTDREVASMTLLQPHLTAAFHHAVLRERWEAQLQRSDEIATVLANLTPREQEVAVLIGQGQSNRQIARALFISERTAEQHVANVFHKLGVASRVAVAIRLSQLRTEPGMALPASVLPTGSPSVLPKP